MKAVRERARKSVNFLSRNSSENIDQGFMNQGFANYGGSGLLELPEQNFASGGNQSMAETEKGQKLRMRKFVVNDGIMR